MAIANPLRLRSTLSWLSYGALKRDWTVIVVNSVGTALQTLYVLMYLHFCPLKVDARLPCTPFCVAHLALPCWHCNLLPRRPAEWHCFSWKAWQAFQMEPS